MDSLMEASSFVQIMEKRQGIMISALEEIAYENGWVTRDSLYEAAKHYGKSTYGKYLRRVADQEVIL